jgi:hypothetical protein
VTHRPTSSARQAHQQPARIQAADPPECPAGHPLGRWQSREDRVRRPRASPPHRPQSLSPSGIIEWLAYDRRTTYDRAFKSQLLSCSAHAPRRRPTCQPMRGHQAARRTPASSCRRTSPPRAPNRTTRVTLRPSSLATQAFNARLRGFFSILGRALTQPYSGQTESPRGWRRPHQQGTLTVIQTIPLANTRR